VSTDTLTDAQFRELIENANGAIWMVRANEIRWTPFTQPLDWLAGVDPDAGLAGIVVRLLHALRVKNELSAASIALLHKRARDINAVGRSRDELRDEIRRYTASAVAGRQA
jgi:hypothetical protein